jgi:hypothetical protein
LLDLQYSLLNDDFAQGSTLCALKGERAVQNWMGDYLRRSQGRSYSIEREPHVVDENEPDIRARSKANDVSVPIEIKIAKSWTVDQLGAALTDQLCGRYLRSKGERHGILLLVHQKARSRGWINPADGRRMEFAEVVEHLRLLAKSIAGADPEDPQPEIAVIDVSSCDVAKTPAKVRCVTNRRGRAGSKGRTSRTGRKGGAPKRKRSVKTTSRAKGRRKGANASTRRTPHRKRAAKRRSPRKRSAH